MVPLRLRPKLLSLSHDKPFGAHMGARRTLYRLTLSFYWPGISGDVTKFCKSCEICLKSRPKGKTPKAPLQIGQVFEKPFYKCAIDLIGPLPMTNKKNRFVLTLIDYTTRWVEAAPLKETTTSAVSEELINFFSRFGLPSVVLSDGGPQFTSDQMEDVLRNLGVMHSVSSPYHPQSNGLCERANATIKSLIKKLSFDNPTSWDRLLQCALFAYREVPQETTGFSPFEMVYGSIPRGPLSFLKENWLSNDSNLQSQSAYEYVSNLKKRIEYSVQMANSKTITQMEKSQKRFDAKSKHRSFKVGDKVLLSLPTTSSKFTSQWRGPFEIVGTVPNSAVNYVVNVDGSHKNFHVDMMQEFHIRPSHLVPSCIPIDSHKTVVNNDVVVDDLKASRDVIDGAVSDSLMKSFEPCSYVNNESSVLPAFSVGVIHEELDQGFSEPSNEFSDIVLPSLKQKETTTDVKINSNLLPSQISDMNYLLDKFSHLFSDIPNLTNAISHEIKLVDNDPVKIKPYPLPFTSLEIVKDEVNSMLELDVIEPSDSPYCSPIVLVKKKDGSIRFCIDFRVLNTKTIGDACPIPDHDYIISKMADAVYFTKLDMTKGYWQIAIDEDCRKFTAFQAAGELYQFKRMPFGLKNAPMTFNRMMNRLIGNREDCVFFFDDVTVFHIDWDEHIRSLDQIFEIFSNGNLRVKPSKTAMGFQEIEFLGHTVGRGIISPLQSNVDKILNLSVPKTKKQVRGLIGLVNFYSKFISNLADLLCPIYALTKKGQPERVTWSNECQYSLEKIQFLISAQPCLIIPNINSLFYVQTDASCTGLGCVLLQSKDGCLRPCRFVSRKLLPRETRYAVIEREALAIVWGLQKLSRFLLGQEFILQTDHAPLRAITSGKSKRSRLCRWALLLQQYSFSVQYLPGHQNVLADYLSRM